MWKEEGFKGAFGAPDYVRGGRPLKPPPTGLAGYMRGNGVNVLRIAPYSAVQFSTYELIKGFLASGGAESACSLRYWEGRRGD